MLADAVLLASELFHELEPRAIYYDQYFRDRRPAVWVSAEALTMADVERLILFLNQWASRYENSSTQRSRLLDALQRAIPVVNSLPGDLLTIDLTRLSLRQDIASIFEMLTTCGSRKEATAGSKILHTIRPDLLVMWDNAIQLAYAVGAASGDDYAHRFLPRMQKLAWRAVTEYAETRRVTPQSAAKSLARCGHTLAKVLDEYNYVKFTMKRDEVWDVEFSPPPTR
jgi:hypothetical protein